MTEGLRGTISSPRAEASLAGPELSRIACLIRTMTVFDLQVCYRHQALPPLA